MHGANYPPPPYTAALAQLAQIAQLLGIAFVMFGDGMFGLLGMQQPAFVKDNKLMIFGALFVLNTMAQNMMATGAFEVTMNGKKVFSKLEAGRMPALEDLVTRFEAAGLAAIDTQGGFSGRG